jgi:hypothetical protein
MASRAIAALDASQVKLLMTACKIFRVARWLQLSRWSARRQKGQEMERVFQDACCVRLPKCQIRQFQGESIFAHGRQLIVAEP